MRRFQSIIVSNYFFVDTRKDLPKRTGLFANYVCVDLLGLNGCLCGGEAGDGHAVGRAGNVVQFELVAELHALRLTTVLTANADVEVGVGGAALAGSHLNELTNTFLVEYLERILLEDAQVLVDGEELASVITRVTEGHLGQVVGTE